MYERLCFYNNNNNDNTTGIGAVVQTRTFKFLKSHRRQGRRIVDWWKKIDILSF